jgi:hypothetical protein
MTRNEQHIDFRVKFNKVNSNKNKSFLPEEIDLFLNDQADRFVEIKTAPAGNYKNEGFEETQKRLDDVRTIIKEGTTNASDATGRTLLTLNTFTYGKYIVLPTNYLKLVSDWSDTSTDCSNHFLTPNRLFSNNRQVQLALKDVFHTTHPKSPISQLIDNQLRVYEQGFTVANIHISYIYKYPKISATQDCVLPTHTHREIVDMAVAKVNSVMNTDNYEKYINEITKNE